MFADIADGLARAMEQVHGLRVSAFPTALPNPPHAAVSLQQVNYHRTNAGTNGNAGQIETVWQVTVTVGRVAERATIRSLYDLIDPTGSVSSSIVLALESDPTLDGKASTLKVMSVPDIGTTVDETPYLVARMEVWVYADS